MRDILMYIDLFGILPQLCQCLFFFPMARASSVAMTICIWPALSFFGSKVCRQIRTHLVEPMVIRFLSKVTIVLADDDTPWLTKFFP